LLEKMAEAAPDDGSLQAAVARSYAEQGNMPLAKSARTKAVAVCEKQLAKEPENTNLPSALADLLLMDTTPWTVLAPVEMKAQGGVILKKLEDDSILVSGVHPAQTVYTLTFRDLPAKFQQLRLEVLTHDSLPLRGPGRSSNGTFHLSTVKAQLVLPEKMSETRNLKLASAWADFNEVSHNVEGAIDALDITSWGIFPQAGRPHVALFELAETAAAIRGAELRVTLEFKSGLAYHSLGRFRLSVSGEPATFDQEEKRLAALRLAHPLFKLGAGYALNDRNDKAVDYFIRAFRANPKIGDDPMTLHHYSAACAAALAAAAQGKNEPPLDDTARAKLRRQALDWLNADLTAWTKRFDSGFHRDRPTVVAKLSDWHANADLASIRDPAALAKLPADERKQWEALWAKVPELRTAVPTANEAQHKWRYTSEEPAEDWHKVDFDDKKWQQGVGGFGAQGTPGAFVRTPWKTEDIWLRAEFTMPEKAWDDLFIRVQHYDDAEFYINGVLALEASGGVGKYVEAPISAEARKAIKPGKNVLAVHCKKSLDRQYIDVGLIAVKGSAARVALAQSAYNRRLFACSAQRWAEALANDPKLADNLQTRDVYNAACSAALAAAGQGFTEPPLDIAAKAKLRRQTLEWLKAELNFWRKQLETDGANQRTRIQNTLLHWQRDTDLNGVRGPALDRFSAEEQEEWAQLWDGISALLKKAQGGQP
jgi:hypothetical protein